MSNTIDNTFNLLQKDINDFINYASTTYLHSSSQAIVEEWANDIIDILTNKTLEPLSEKTIDRRKRRGQDIIGPDYPLLETGEWITYIEFRINQFSDHDEIEVGVWDESIQIGHSSNRSPAYIAEVNEYGREDIHIPGRHLFTISEIKVSAKLDAIINDTWNKLNIIDIPESIQTTHNLIGRIFYNGSNFIFRWDE